MSHITETIKSLDARIVVDEEEIQLEERRLLERRAALEQLRVARQVLMDRFPVAAALADAPIPEEDSSGSSKKVSLAEGVTEVAKSFGRSEFSVPEIESRLKEDYSIETTRPRISWTLKLNLVDKNRVRLTHKGRGAEPNRYRWIYDAEDDQISELTTERERSAA